MEELMKLKSIIEAKDAIVRLTAKRFTDYKKLREIVKLRKAVEAEYDFYCEQEKKLVETYGEKTDKGIIGYAYSHSKRELTLVLNKKFPYDNFTRATIGTHISYAYTMYESHGFMFDDCENTVMENITCHVSGGMGLRFDNGKNAYLNNVNFCQKEGSNRVMTCTADIIHGCALEGELIITNCHLFC